ncbi:MAG: efflux RND transporter periplasmic adaptor subunit [Calditrichaeota bacterium]|nr:efflux RND transporter periplasmic adaptor subunit [Calditrichota bacterium]
MKRIISVFLAIGILSLGLFAGCSKKANTRKGVEKTMLSVKTTVVTHRSIKEYHDFTGNILPNRKLKVMPNISGKIARIFVKEGQFVKAGTVIAMLDTEMFSYQLKQAEAGVAVARANLHDMQLNWKRIQELKKKGSISDQQFEKMRVGYEAAKAKMQQAKAALDMARYQMRSAKMKAPFSGFVGIKYLDEGDIVNPMMPGGPGICTLVDISSVRITTHVSEADFSKLKIGQTVDIHVDTYPDRTFKGVVESVVPVGDPASRSFQVNIRTKNPGYLLKSGMFARLRVLTATHQNVLAIPVDALHLEGQQSFVFTLDSNNVAHKIPIKTGIMEAHWVEVLSGVTAGETIVTIGKDALVEGERVNVVQTNR